MPKNAKPTTKPNFLTTNGSQNQAFCRPLEGPKRPAVSNLGSATQGYGRYQKKRHHKWLPKGPARSSQTPESPGGPLKAPGHRKAPAGPRGGPRPTKTTHSEQAKPQNQAFCRPHTPPKTPEAPETRARIKARQIRGGVGI